jgi:hypothetical protein
LPRRHRAPTAALLNWGVERLRPYVFFNVTCSIKMSHVFLSHSSKDKQFVRMLKYFLGQFGVHVWLDEDELGAGDSLFAKIEAAVEEIDVLAIILSPNSVSSPWVRQELEQALARKLRKENIRVVPVLLRDCDIPGFLKPLKYVDARAWRPRGRRSAEVLRRVAQELAKGAGAHQHDDQCFSGKRVVKVRDLIAAIEKHFAPRPAEVHIEPSEPTISWVTVRNPDGTLSVFGDVTRPTLVDMLNEVFPTPAGDRIVGVDFSTYMLWTKEEMAERDQLIRDGVAKRGISEEDFWRSYGAQDSDADDGSAMASLRTEYDAWLLMNQLVSLVTKSDFGASRFR